MERSMEGPRPKLSTAPRGQENGTFCIVKAQRTTPREEENSRQQMLPRTEAEMPEAEKRAVVLIKR